MLDDLYTIIDVENKLGGVVERTVGGFDLVYNKGPVKPEVHVASTRPFPKWIFLSNP